MENYPYKVSGIYHEETLAHSALDKLRNSGFPAEQLRLIGPRDPKMGAKLEPEGQELPKEIIKDSLIGAGVGGALGVVGAAALAIAQTALIATNPVLSTLVIAGYGAAVGSVAGAYTGVKMKETDFLGVVEDALQQGYWVVVAHARDEAEEERARELIGETAAERQVNT